MFDEMATFCTVVKCGSMSKAAAEMHLSQPAISLRLRTLEQSYGVQLLRRTNRGVEVTPAGEVVVRYAHRFLGMRDSLQREMDALRANTPKQAVIGATTTVGSYALPCTVYLFQQEHPEARIQLQIANRTEIMQRLEDGSLDLALVEGTPLLPSEIPDGWQSAVVSEEELMLITPTEGPLSKPDGYDLDLLKRTPLIVRERGSGTREVVEKALQEQGLALAELPKVMEMSSLDAVKTSVVAGHGVALISRWCVKVEVRLGTLRLAPVQGMRFHSTWTLLCPAVRKRSPLVRALVSTLRSPAERGFC